MFPKVQPAYFPRLTSLAFSSPVDSTIRYRLSSPSAYAISLNNAPLGRRYPGNVNFYNTVYQVSEKKQIAHWAEVCSQSNKTNYQAIVIQQLQQCQVLELSRCIKNINKEVDR